MILTYRKIKKILRYLIAALVVTSSVSASDYCFNNKKPIHQIRYELKSYLIDGEKVSIDSNRHCLNVTTLPERVELIAKIIKSKFPDEFVSRTRPTLRNSFCKFKFKEETKLKEEKVERITDLIGIEDKSFSIDIAGDSFYLTCRRVEGKYLVEIYPENKSNEVTSLTLDASKWLDLSSFSKLEDKKYSLMVITQ